MDEPIPTNPAVADAHALYLAFGGRQHRQIEAAMRAKGYTTFTRRVFYDRLERGKLRLGWIRRYKWNVHGTEPPAIACGMTRRRNPDTPKHASGVHAQPDQQKPAANRAWSDPFSRKRRRMEIRSFRKWLERVSPGMSWDWAHLKYLYGKLADVTTGKTKRLMIFMPPRHGKSELVTVRYAAWRIKQDPTLNVIIGSYNQRLANRFSRKIRITWEDSVQIENRELKMENKAERVSGPTTPAGFKQDIQDEHDKENKNHPAYPVHPVDSSSPRHGSPNTRLYTVAEWETGMGGGVRAVGVGAGITGYGGKLVIIDDPIKSRSEAESETYRNRAWEWFNDDIYTRLEPDAGMILIQTRWHEDDLAGRLLEEMQNGGEQWEVVSLPAIAESEPPASAGGLTSNKLKQDIQDEQDIKSKMHPAYPVHPVSSSFTEIRDVQTEIRTQQRFDPIGRHPGEPLCPARFNLAELQRIRRQLGEYSFAALYQQRPMPLEGGLFKKKWFKQIVDQAPAGLRWFRGYDLAISTKTSADFTASARCAIDRNGNLFIADVFRARLEYPDQRKFVVDRLINERDTEHGIEKASSRTGVHPGPSPRAQASPARDPAGERKYRQIHPGPRLGKPRRRRQGHPRQRSLGKTIPRRGIRVPQRRPRRPGRRRQPLGPNDRRQKTPVLEVLGTIDDEPAGCENIVGLVR